MQLSNLEKPVEPDEFNSHARCILRKARRFTSDSPPGASESSLYRHRGPIERRKKTINPLLQIRFIGYLHAFQIVAMDTP